MASFVQKLTTVLRQKFPTCELELEDVGGHRVGGFLIWKGFSKLDQLDRQEKLSRVLERSLSPKDRLRISAILTMTPEEMDFARQG